MPNTPFLASRHAARDVFGKRPLLRKKLGLGFYLAIFLIGLTASSVAAASLKGLVGQWSFDEGAGTTTADLSGQGNAGTLINEPNWSAGKFGYGLSFNGVDQHVEIAHTDVLNLSKELTVSAWIYNNGAANALLPDPEFHIIASKGWAPDAGGSWTLAWDKKSNDLSFCVRRGSDKGYACVFFDYESLSKDWHHIAAVFASGKLSLYINGQLAAKPVDLKSTTIMSNAENIRIGAVLEKPSVFLQSWDGSLDELQIYSRALTDTEIKTLFQETGSQQTSGSPTTSPSTTAAAEQTSRPGKGNIVAAPVITPNGGSFAGQVSVTLTTVTSGAAIYYTTDGTVPTQSSNVYNGPITVTTDTMVKAKAFKQNAAESTDASAWFAFTQSFDFSLSNTGDKAANKGASAQNAITAALKSGSSKAISFSVSGLPSGATSAFSTISCNPSCSSTLTINTSGSTPSGIFPINVTGSDGGVSRSTSFNLTVSDLPTVATPTITPNGGSYTGSVSVTMATATGGASIRYTTDGSNPTTSSPLYSSAINLTNTATVKAAAFMSGYNPSSTASAAFTITQPFDFSLRNAGNKSLVAGSFTTNSITATLLSGSAQTVTFSASGLPAGVTASFSSPSCAPTCSSTLTLNTTAGTTPAGTFPITVLAPTGNGLNRTTTFNLTVSLPTVATPTITPNGGSFLGSVSVTMATATSDASIYYTTNGTSPTQSSMLYTGATTLTSSTVVKAKAFKGGYNPSAETSASFTINQPFDFSLASSGNKSVTAGGSVTNSITANLLSGATQSVTFGVSGLPSGAAGAFSSASCTPTCSADLNITTSGSTPTGNFSITVSATVGGVARTTAFTLTVAAPTVVSTVATPTITPNGGSFTSSVTVTLATATSGASIYYTTDGSSPTQSSKLYTGAMTLTSSAFLKAKAFKSGYNPSAEVSASFMSDLIAYWKFDEGTGTTVADHSGNGNSGTLVNGPQWTPGIAGKSLYFDGHDDNVTVLDSATLNPSSSFTVSAWVNPGTVFTDFRSILVKNYKYYLYSSSTGYCGDGTPLAGFRDTTNKILCEQFPLPVNTWTHLAASYDGSTLTLYRNGIVVVAAAASGTPVSTTGSLQIGASEHGEFFKGLIDEVRIYNRSLSGAEVQAVYKQNAPVIQPFDFTLSNSGAVSLIAGSLGSNSINATLASGSTQSVSFSISGLPSGATGSFSAASCSPTCSSLLNITTSGSTPTGSYPITVSATGGGVTKITAFTLSVTLALTVGTPIITPTSGSFSDSASVTIQTATSGASIYYTTNGSIPTQFSDLYTGAMSFAGNTTVNTRAFKAGYDPSAIASASFAVYKTTGNVYYVATSGSDAVACATARNIATPKRTISNALGCLRASDTLYIRAGTYYERINDTTSFGTANQPITIAGYPGDARPVIRMPSNENPDTQAWNVAWEASRTPRYLIMRGFEINTIDNEHRSGCIRVDAPNVTIEDVILRNCGRDGIMMRSRAVIVRNSQIINCGRNQPSTESDTKGIGFYIAPDAQDGLAGENIFERNIVDGCRAGGGVIHYNNADNNIIRYNIFRNFGTASPWPLPRPDFVQYGTGVTIGGDGVWGSPGPRNNQIYKNIIHVGKGNERASECFNLWGTGSGNVAYENVCYDVGIFIRMNANGWQDVSFWKNIISKVPVERVDNGSTLVGTYSNNLNDATGGAIFVDATNGDFGLK